MSDRPEIRIVRYRDYAMKVPGGFNLQFLRTPRRSVRLLSATRKAFVWIVQVYGAL